jgi:hypothetical protein
VTSTGHEKEKLTDVRFEWAVPWYIGQL